MSTIILKRRGGSCCWMAGMVYITPPEQKIRQRRGGEGKRGEDRRVVRLELPCVQKWAL